MIGDLRVDWRGSLALVGTVVKYLSVALLVPIALAAFEGDDLPAFLVTAAVAVGLGVAMERLDTEPDLGGREGFLVVAMTWLFVSLVGALPYVIAGMGLVEPGSGSSLANPVNALFESMSGFTTTGATVMGTSPPTPTRGRSSCGASRPSGSAAWASSSSRWPSSRNCRSAERS